MRLVIGITLLASVTGCSDQVTPKRQTGRNPASIGFIDAPLPQTTVGASFSVAGWAIDESGIERVRIYLDDQLVATIPLTVWRPDVERAFPRATPGAPHGFATIVDGGACTGYCTVSVEAIDGRGGLTRFATSSIRIEQ